MPCCCLSHTERSSRTHATLAPAQTLAFIVSATLGIFLQVMDPKAAPALRAPLLKNFFFSNKKTVHEQVVAAQFHRSYSGAPSTPSLLIL